jgi:hypothetical protein
LLKLEPSKEAPAVGNERGALKLADLVERALVYVMDKGTPTSARTKTGGGTLARKSNAGSVRPGFPPPIRPAGPLNFLSHLMHFCEEPGNVRAPRS